MNERVNYFEFGAKILLYAIAALLPLWVLPLSVGVELGREASFGILIILAGIFWLLTLLLKGEIRIQQSLFLYAGGIFFLTFLLSTFFSKVPFVSAVFADPSAEKLLSIALGIVLMVFAGSVLKSKEETGVALFLLVVCGGLAAFLYSVQLLFNFSLFRYIPPFISGQEFNAVGTANGFALFSTILFATGLGLLTSISLENWKPWLRYGLLASLFFLFLNIFLINFRISWVALLGSGIFLFGLLFQEIRRSRGGGGEDGARGISDWRYILAIVLVAFSIVMLLIREPIFTHIVLPQEISPSMGGMYAIARSALRENVRTLLLGTGPGTFGPEWSRFKDASVNLTPFWNFRFNQGYSWISTLLVTNGILGVVSFLLFLSLGVFIFLRGVVLFPVSEIAVSVSAFLGFIAALFAAFLYPANFSIMMFFFFSAGLLNGILGKREGETKPVPFWKSWDIHEYVFRFDNQWTVFLSSLLAVFSVALGVSGFYLEVNRLRVAYAFEKGVDLLNQGKFPESLAAFEKTVKIEMNNPRNYQALVQARTEKVRNLIQRASGGENVQQDFQTTVSETVKDIQRGIVLSPEEPLLWRAQGAFYELLIPFIQGSERLSFSSYQKATELDPVNPSAWVDLGRPALLYADRLQILLGQAAAKDRAPIIEARRGSLDEARKAFEKAADLKQDYATAHFLLSQALIRLGNLQEAIVSTEKAKWTAPFDVGIAFQLGLLYYQSGDFDRAQAELERAVSLNDNYANARYFLGLIYDRRGDKTKAMSEFLEIRKFNPDNQEVEKIIDNLERGKSALSSIVPPAEPPERRRETPIKESGRK